IVIAIDDRPVQTPEALVRLIQSRSPGDVVEVTLLREGEEQILDATLGYHSGRSIRGDFQNQLGSELSSRAVDFPAVLQHDSILNGHQMGGPIVDLKGRILGINIARAGRVETYALPAQVLEQAIPALLSGKLPTATGPALTEEGKPPVQTEPGREYGASRASLGEPRPRVPQDICIAGSFDRTRSSGTAVPRLWWWARRYDGGVAEETSDKGSDGEPVWTDERLRNPHAVADKQRRVRDMFAAIAPSYDLNNRLFSFGTDQRWRRKAVKLSRLKADDVVVDVACGTGDLTLAYADGLLRAG